MADRAPLLARVFDELPVGIAIIDPDLRLRDCNPIWVTFVETFTETTSNDIVPGRTLWEISPATADYLEPLLRRVLKGEKIRRDGIRLEKGGLVTHWDLFFEPLYEGGEITGVIDITTEATSRVRSAQLAAEREATFRQIFEATSDAVIITDPETSLVVEANPACCRMHGYTHDEFVGLHPTTFIHPNSHYLFAEYMETTRSGRAFRSRATDVRKDGTLIPIEVSGSMGDYGGRQMLIAVVRDISEQLRSEAALEEAAKERALEVGMLLEVSNNIASTRDIGVLLDLVLERLRPVIAYSAAAVMVLDDDDNLRLLKYRGPREKTTWDGPQPLASMPFCEKVIRRRLPNVISNAYTADNEAAEYRKWQRRGGEDLPLHSRSWMGIPLLVNDNPIGLIGFTHEVAGYYNEDNAALALAFANQAAAAIDNARLFEELTTNSRELATLFDVAQSLSSTLEFDRLIDLVLEQLHHLIDYTGASIVTLEGGKLEIVSARLTGTTPRPLARGLQFDIGDAGAIWQHVLDGHPVLIDDVRSESQAAKEYRAVVGPLVDTVFGSVRTWMAVPLAVNDRVFGMLTCSRDIPGYFTQHDLQLAQALAGQASIALDNARLFAEAEARTRERSTLLEVARNLTSTLELRSLLSVILEQLQLTVDSSNATVYDTRDNELRVLAMQRNGQRVEGPLQTFPLSDVPVNREVMDRKEPIIVDDIHDDSPISRTFRSVWEKDPALIERFGAIHCWLGVPLIAKDTVIGMLTLEHTAPAHFGPQHAALAMAFANQAATAIENVRLFEEAKKRANEMEALSRVAAALTIDQPASATLDVIAGRVVAATNAMGCSVSLMGGRGSASLFGSAGLAPGFVEAMDAAIRAGASSAAVRSFRSQTREVSHNARRRLIADPKYAPVHEMLLQATWDTVVITPLVSRGRSLGTLNTFYPPGYEPDDDEVALVSAIADQAAIAVENRRLFAETERRIRETDALYRADEQLHQSLRLDEVLEALVDVAVNIMGADKSLVAVTNPETGRPQVRVHRGYSPAAILAADELLTRLTPNGFADRTDAFVVENAEADPRTFRAVVEPEGIQAYIDLPISIANNVFGIFNLSFMEQRRFSDDDRRLFAALAQRAAVAIENARLFGRAQLAAGLEERQRLARELHDSVSQALYGIALGARTARAQLDRDPAKAGEPLDYVLSLAEAGLAELRSLIFELRPESLETEGLVAAFQKQFAALRARHGIAVESELGEEPDARIEIKEAIYRIGQEALNNTVKHARATTVNVILSCEQGRLVLVVRDDGRGFDPDGEFPGHLGLQTMAERARALGGTLEITSAPGAGTTVRLVTALPKAN